MDNGESSYRRFLCGDDNGFIEIVKEYKDGLILYLDSFVRNISLSEELAEDTFVKLGIKKPRFSGKSSFKTWLYAIGRNVAVDHLRKQSKSKTVPLDECENLADTESLELSYIREERKILVHRAMRDLKPEYRQILWLIYFEGCTCREAASLMKTSTHNAETLVYRARKALKAELLKKGFTNENL